MAISIKGYYKDGEEKGTLDIDGYMCNNLFYYSKDDTSKYLQIYRCHRSYDEAKRGILAQHIESLEDD